MRAADVQFERFARGLAMLPPLGEDGAAHAWFRVVTDCEHTLDAEDLRVDARKLDAAHSALDALWDELGRVIDLALGAS